MEAKMFYTATVSTKLAQLNIKRNSPNNGRLFIAITENNTYYFMEANVFVNSELPFLEERDLLKMSPAIKKGDYIQIAKSYSVLIQEVIATDIEDETIIVASDNPGLTIHYHTSEVKRVPDYIIEVLKEEGFIND